MGTRANTTSPVSWNASTDVMTPAASTSTPPITDDRVSGRPNTSVAFTSDSRCRTSSGVSASTSATSLLK